MKYIYFLCLWFLTCLSTVFYMKPACFVSEHIFEYLFFQIVRVFGQINNILFQLVNFRPLFVDGDAERVHQILRERHHEYKEWVRCVEHCSCVFFITWDISIIWTSHACYCHCSMKRFKHICSVDAYCVWERFYLVF